MFAVQHFGARILLQMGDPRSGEMWDWTNRGGRIADESMICTISAEARAMGRFVIMVGNQT